MREGAPRDERRGRDPALWRAIAALSYVRRSVGGKVMAIVLATTAIAFVCAGSALLITELRQSRIAWRDDLATEANILALATVPALAAGDVDGARRSLEALRAKESIRIAAVYTPDGLLFASYARSGSTPPRVPPAADVARDSRGERAALLHDVTQNGARLGTIYLQAQYDVTGRVVAYLNVLLFVLLLGVTVALLTARWLRGAITTPLIAMANVARQVVERGDYTLRVREGTSDETGVVTRAFNRMLEEVQESDRRKDEFLATLAHELRNPLAPIRNAVRILDMPAADERTRKWGREVIARQVHHMALLLDDLLDVSRITRGQLELRREHVDLAQIVAVALETARPIVDRKRHQLDVVVPPEPIRLDADALRLSQAIGNLLTNAAKYTDPGGHIQLVVTREPDELRIRVRDDGIGLAPENMPNLFTMFSQVRSVVDRAEGGLGIGLALVKGLTGLHGGTVEAHSEGLGRGSQFTMRLPRALVVEDSLRLPAATDEVLAPTIKESVLVVDDNRDACESLAVRLRLSGYDVTTATSGPAALQLFPRVRPAAVLLDIGMPGMDGYEVAQRLRRDEAGRVAVLVALTGWGQENDKERARIAGFDAHFTKPVETDHLLAQLATLLATRARQAQAATPARSLGA